MVKKKRKAKQKRITDAHSTVTGPVSSEESPLYIDIASPGTPAAADRYRAVPRQGVEDLGTAQPELGLVSGSIVGLTSGEIRIDHDAALSVHFESERPKKKPSILVAEDDAVLEEPEVYAARTSDSDPEGPTPAPHLRGQRPAPGVPDEEAEAPIEDLGPALPEEAPVPVADDAATATEAPVKSRRRRNTLPQHARTGEHPTVGPTGPTVGPTGPTVGPTGPTVGAPSRPMEPIVSGEFTVVSGEIMLVPEEDIPAKPRPVPKVAEPKAPPPLPAATRPEPPPPPPPPATPMRDTEVTAPSEPSHPDDEPSPEELARRQEARDHRRKLLRDMVAQAPVPFAMNIPDKSAPATDAGFIPAAPAVVLGSEATRPMAAPATPAPPPPAPPSPVAVTPPAPPPEPSPVPPPPDPPATSHRHDKVGRVTGQVEARHEKHPERQAQKQAEKHPEKQAQKQAEKHPEKHPEKQAEKTAPAGPVAAGVPSGTVGGEVSIPAAEPDPPPSAAATPAAATPATEPGRPRRTATPLENSLVSTNMELTGQHLSGRLPRAATRDDLPVKFSDLEEEFFDKELHPENDYSGLDEVFAQMQEQNQPNGGILGSLKRLFVADAPQPKNGATPKPTPAPKPAAKKPKGGHGHKKK